MSFSLVLAVSATALTSVIAPAAAVADTAPSPTASSPTSTVSPEEAASQTAQATGVAQVVDALTTSTSQTTANPDGTFSLSQSLLPVRVKRGDGWVPVDLTLAVGADGLVRPNAGPSPVVFSGGGSGPLVSATGPDGRAMTVQYPSALPTLPAPTLDGPTATYADVLPDVDLVVSATATGGFSEVFRVKTAQAGANPALKTVSLEVTTPGMSMSVDSTTNTLTATDTSGNVQFHAPTPTMWDSTTPAGVTSPDPQAAPPVVSDPAQSDATGPGVQAATDPMPTTLAAAPSGAPANTDTVTVHPDLSMLSDPATVYPVYIDPYYAPFQDGMLNYTWVQQGCPTTSNYDSTARSPGAGLNGYSGCVGVERTFYQMDTSPLAHATIGSATLETTVNYSAQYCPSDPSTATPWVFAVYYSNPITSGTTWNNQPALVSGYPGSAQSVTHCQGQGNLNVAFDVTAAVRAAATNSWPNATFRLGGNESDSRGWKRFTNNPVMNVTYDRPPNTPTNLTMNPAPVNGFLGRGNAVSGLTLSAAISSVVSKQTVHGDFSVTDTTTNKVVYQQTSADVAQSGTVSVQVPSSVLVDGHALRWTVVADDDILTSTAATGPGVTLDTTPPSLPGVSSAEFPAIGTTPPNGSANVRAVGQGGSLTVTATDTGTSPSGIARIDWQLNTALSVGTPASSTTSGSTTISGGPSSTTATINVTPYDWGTNVLYVRSVDRAGNYSQNATYYFFVRSDTQAPTPDSGRITGIRYSDDMATVVAGSNPSPGSNGQGAGKDESTCDVLKIDPVSASDPSLTAGSTPGTSNGPSTPTPTPTATGSAAAPPPAPVPYEAAQCVDAPNGSSWAGALVAHASSFEGQAYDDLVVWQNGIMVAYTNGGPAAKHDQPIGYFDNAGMTTITHPVVGSATPDWTTLKSFTVVPDTHGHPDLVTVETFTGSPRLYLYPAAIGASLGAGIDITPAGMSSAQLSTLGNLTLMSPGAKVVTATNYTPTLWMRDGSSGANGGAVYQMTGTSTAALDPSTFTTIANPGTFSPSIFPSATMIGTYHNGIPEIITSNTVGQLARQQLTSTSPSGSAPSPFTTAAVTGPWFVTGGGTTVENGTNQTPSDYVPLKTPVRAVDTRHGTGTTTGAAAKLTAGTLTQFSVTPALSTGSGTGPGSPAGTVTAVAVNAVLLNASQSTYIRFGPNGPGDATSSIDATANTITSGSAVIPVDASGHITATLGPGQADLIIDVTGYFTTQLDGTQAADRTTSPSVYVPTTQTRVCDSRKPANPPTYVPAPGCATIPASGSITINLSGQSAYGSLHDPTGDKTYQGTVTAVAVNLTAPNWTNYGAVTAWSAGTEPGTSVLNPLPDQAIATSSIIGLDSTGSFRLAASGGGDIIIDVVGYYVSDITAPTGPTAASPIQIPGATRFVSLPGSRILRTDTGFNAPGGAFTVGAGTTVTFAAAGATDTLGNQVTPTTSATNPQLCSALINVESFNPNTSGYLGVLPGPGQPPVSGEQPLTDNYDSVGTQANTFIARTDPNGNLQVTNNAPGTTNIAVDVTGYYAPIPTTLGGTGQCTVAS